MNFSEALQALRDGKLARRRCWQNQEVFISFKEKERVVLITDGSYSISYDPSDTDLTSTDWQVYDS